MNYDHSAVVCGERGKSLKSALFLFAGFALNLVGQTTVYLPAVGATSCQVTAASSSTPSEITCANHGFAPGQVIAIINEASSQTAGFIINGLRKVATVVNANNFTITDINGNNVVGPANFACPNAGTVEAFVHPLNCRAVPLTGYTAQSHPRVYGLDGPTGPLATSLQNTGPTGKANAANIPYAALQSSVAGWTTSAVPLHPDQGDTTGQAALQYWMNGDPTAKTKALNGISNAAYNLTAGGFACDETQIYCYWRQGATEYVSGWDHALYALAYSILRGDLSSGQRQTFANQVLNDLSHSENGLGSQGGDIDCTKIPFPVESGTVTIMGTSVVGNGTHFTSLSVNGLFWPAIPGYGDNETIIASITDDTHLTLIFAPSSGDGTAINYRYGAPWTTGNCGAVWLVKHHPAAPFADETNYPLSPGYTHYARGENNLTITKLMGWINLGLALADDDPRAVELLAISSAYYYDAVLPVIKQEWTGTSFTNNDYFNDRWLFFTPMIDVALKNGVVNGPDYFSTSVAWKRAMAQAYLNYMPGAFASNGGTWGQPASVSWDVLHSHWFGLLAYMYPTSAEAGYFTWWVRNSSALNAYRSAGVWTGGNGYAIPPILIFSDPNATQTSVASAPTQYVFKDNDSSQCVAYGWSFCTPSYGMRYWLSRTDNLASSATLLTVNAQDYYGGDHTTADQSGTYQIMKNGVFLFGANHPVNLCGQGCNNDGADTSTLEFGSQSNWLKVNTNYFASHIIRWSGADPTGDAQSRYSYGLVDLSGQYQSAANVTLAYRHVAHFKKSGFQDYIVVYDAMSTSSGLSKAAYLWDNLNGGTYPGGVSRSGNVITSSQSSAGMVSTILSPSGQTNYVTETTWSGPAGYGVKVCAAASSAPTVCDTSNLNSEWMVVHMPSTSVPTMPPLTQLSATGFRVVQIADPSSPKVAAFSIGSGTYTALSFTSTHSGTAQYLVAGLTPGTYAVTVGGSAVSGSPFTVNSGDSTLYFESSAGTVNVSAGTGGTGGQPPPLNACDLNSDGLVNVVDISVEIGVALGQGACTPKFDINQDGVCNVVDVVRITNSALGLGCVLGP